MSFTKFKMAVKRNPYIYCIVHRWKQAMVSFVCAHRNLQIKNEGTGNIKKFILGGENNSVLIGKGTFLENPVVRIKGNNCRLIFGEDCHIGENCSFWMEGNDISIVIGSKTSFTGFVHFCAQEDNMSICVGEDCMFSNHIIVRTSDSHPIYDNEGKRINLPKKVQIGNHVWIAPDTKIMKGSVINDGVIVASNTMVNAFVPTNTMVAGCPAKVVKKEVNWSREALF